MVPTPSLRAAWLVALAAVATWWLPLPGTLLAGAGLLVVIAADAYLAPHPDRIAVERTVSSALPLDATGELRWELGNPVARRVTVAVTDELPPSLGASTRRLRTVLPAGGRRVATAALHPTRRGTRTIGGLTVRVTGPLGLASRQARRVLEDRVEVHPRFRSRAAAELRLRQARLLQEGARSVRDQGSAGTFEQLRAYVDGDEVRHVDWAATARRGTPIVRTYRAERSQPVVIILDTGRASAGLVDGVPRLDHAMDAALALTTVALHLDDRVGSIAAGGQVRAVVPARAGPGQLRRLSSAMHDLAPELVETDHRAALRTVLGRFRRRALVVVLTDLAPGASELTLLPALPALVRAHRVVVAAVSDPALSDALRQPPDGPDDAYLAVAAAELAERRAADTARVRAAGAEVVDAPPDQLPAALCDRYLEVKRRGGW